MGHSSSEPLRKLTRPGAVGQAVRPGCPHQPAGTVSPQVHDSSGLRQWRDSCNLLTPCRRPKFSPRASARKQNAVCPLLPLRFPRQLSGRTFQFASELPSDIWPRPTPCDSQVTPLLGPGGRAEPARVAGRPSTECPVSRVSPAEHTPCAMDTVQ